MMVCCQPFWWLMKKKECPKMKWPMRGKKLRVTVARSSDMWFYLDNWNSIDFDDKRKAADILILTIRATVFR